jgi:hypothetical protein
VEDTEAPWDRRIALARAQTLGIDELVVVAEPTRAVAALVLSGFEYAHGRGAPMASRLVFAREGAASLRMAVYLPRSDAIVVNLDDRFWDDPEMQMRRFAEQRLFPSDYPGYPVLHELGHRAHHQALSDPNLWLVFRSTRLGRDERRIIQQEVGINAARDVLEFVADVYAMQLEGRPVSDRIAGLYERFGGPMR